MRDWVVVSFPPFFFPLRSLEDFQHKKTAKVNDLTDGFFDAGMLLQALKARGEGLDGGADSKPATAARRREIGKKLRLSEY